MKEFAHLLRQQYISTLTGTILDGKTIPINDEINTVGVKINANYEAYIVITNQTANPGQANKCGDNYLASIQVLIVTKSQLNNNGKLVSERISAEVLSKLSANPIQLTDFNIWKTKLESNRGLMQESDTSRIYQKILVFSHNLTE